MIIVLSGYGQEDLCCQHGGVARNEERVAQVGQRFHEQQQERAGHAGDQQRQGDGAEDVELARAQAVGSFFHAGIEPLQHGADDEISHGEEGNDLHEY